MRALVLGGNGFIGSHVVDALLAAGHKVRIFDRAEDRYRPKLAGVEYVIGSFDETFLVAEALADVEVVFHCISTTVPSTSNLDPVSDIQSNLINTVRLLQRMVEKGVSRIVYLSSGGTVYGRPTRDPVPVDHPLHPICSYGVVKVAVENYLNMYRELHGVRPVVLRASNPYGERQGHLGVQGVIGTFLGKTMRGESIEIWGDGSVVRDFIYVGDLARLCVQAAESDACGVFNVGSGVGYSIREILDTITAVTNTKTSVDYKPSRNFDIQRVVLDISDTLESFDWQPSTTLPRGIQDTWKWLNEFVR